MCYQRYHTESDQTWIKQNVITPGFNFLQIRPYIYITSIYSCKSLLKDMHKGDIALHTDYGQTLEVSKIAKIHNTSNSYSLQKDLHTTL